MITKSKKGIVKSKAPFSGSVTDTTTPITVSNALANPVWHKAMLKDFAALQQNSTWSLVPVKPSIILSVAAYLNCPTHNVTSIMLFLTIIYRKLSICVNHKVLRTKPNYLMYANFIKLSMDLNKLLGLWFEKLRQTLLSWGFSHSLFFILSLHLKYSSYLYM